MDYDVYPWSVRQRIYERDGVEILQTTVPSWVLKLQASRYFSQRELTFLKRVCDKGPPVRNMIELPPEPDRRFGTNWYAMRRYSGSVYTYPTAAWRRLGCDVLNFLEDLHRGYSAVHMDIVTRNILATEYGTFVVSDYELLVDMPGDDEPAVACDCDDTLWYYLGAGAELSEPLYAWRMDLNMLGYCLAELTWGDDVPDFPHLCQRRRQDTCMDISDYDILARRNEEMQMCHPTVRAYLDRVAALVPWRATEAPTSAVYDELRALLQRSHTTLSDKGDTGSSEGADSSLS